LRFAIQDAFFSILLYAQAPIPKALVDAKTAYLVDDGAGAGRMDDLAKELTQWGRFTLVDSVEASDVTIRFGGFVVFKVRGIGNTSARTNHGDELPTALQPGDFEWLTSGYESHSRNRTRKRRQAEN
jgi:hypothetical protein